VGYRSEVVLAVSPEAASAFMALCAKHPEVMQLCHDADKFTSGYEQPGDYLMHWSSIKWYEDYPEIAWLMLFIEHLESDDLTEFGEKDDPEDGQWHECFKFIRLGEDNEDYDQRGYGFPDIMSYRALSF
jgi:hypothetical protein